MEKHIIKKNIESIYHNITDSSLILAPTDNCQLFSIASFNFCLVKSKEDCTKAIKDMLGESNVNVNMKHLMLCDINEEYFKTVREYYKEAIVIHKKYNSSNKSKMRLVILDTRLI